MVMTAYPVNKEHLSSFASKRDLNVAVNGLIDRVGALRDLDAATIEDRLYTLEILMLDVLIRLEKPPGQISVASPAPAPAPPVVTKKVK
jgi:hypothetical protein